MDTTKLSDEALIKYCTRWIENTRAHRRVPPGIISLVSGTIQYHSVHKMISRSQRNQLDIHMFNYATHPINGNKKTNNG